MPKVLIVDDHVTLRRGLRALLYSKSGTPKKPDFMSTSKLLAR
jgi:hypothetical protein